MVLGIGTGSTTNYFIEIINNLKPEVKGVVCSSNASQEKLKKIFNASIKVIAQLNVFCEPATKKCLKQAPK